MTEWNDLFPNIAIVGYLPLDLFYLKKDFVPIVNQTIRLFRVLLSLLLEHVSLNTEVHCKP